MRKMSRMIFLLTLLGCSPGLAPNGKSWEEFYAAKYQLVVTHNAAETANCEELGQVRGSDYDALTAAKESAEEQAVVMGGNTLLYTELSSELKPYHPIRRERELFHADGTVYNCPP